MKRVQVIVLITVMALACAALSGCGTPPDQAVAGFLDALKAMNPNGMAEHMLNADMNGDDALLKDVDPSTQLYLRSILSRVTYETHTPTIKGAQASVPVTITCVDLLRVVVAVLPDAFSMSISSAFGGADEDAIGDAMTQLFENRISAPDAPMVSTNMDFRLRKERGRWLIEYDENTATALTNAITGDIGSLAGAW